MMLENDCGHGHPRKRGIGMYPILGLESRTGFVAPIHSRIANAVVFRAARTQYVGALDMGRARGFWGSNQELE